MIDDNRSNDYAEHLANLKLQVELVKKDISFITTLFEKMDKVMSKIEVQHDTILDKTNLLIDSKVKLTTDDLSDLCDALEQTKLILHERINSIEKILLSELTVVKDTLTTHILDDNSIKNKVNKIIYAGTGVSVFLIWVFNNLDFIKHVLK